MTSQTCCLFCLRLSPTSCSNPPEVEGEGQISLKNVPQNEKNNRKELQDNFIRILKRYLLEDNLKLDFFKYPNRKVESAMEPCVDCLEVLKSFCDLYREIKVLELRMNWRLETLINIVRSSKKVKSRMTRFQMMVKKLTADVEELDMFCLVRSLENFKEDFVNQCSLRVCSGYPKVSVNKLSEQGGIKSGQNDNHNENNLAKNGASLRKIRSKIKALTNNKRQSVPCEADTPEPGPTEAETPGSSSAEAKAAETGATDAKAPEPTEVETHEPLATDAEGLEPGAEGISLPVPLPHPVEPIPATETKVIVENERNINHISLKKDETNLFEARETKACHSNLFSDNAKAGSNDGVKDKLGLTRKCNVNPSKKRTIEGKVKQPSDHENVTDRNLMSTSPESNNFVTILNENCSESPEDSGKFGGAVTKRLKMEKCTEINTVDAEHSVKPDANSTTSEDTRATTTTEKPGGEEDSEHNQVGTEEDMSVDDNYDDASPAPPSPTDILNVLKKEETLEKKLSKGSSSPVLQQKSEEVKEEQSPSLGRRRSYRTTHKCSSCSKTFTSNYTLSLHQNICSKLAAENDDFESDHCDDGSDGEPQKEKGKQGPVKREVVNKIHENETDALKQNYPCPVDSCKFSFYNPVDLENHSKLHGNFKCSFCSIEKSYAPQLSVHELSHKKFHSSHGEDALKKAEIFYLCPHCSFSSMTRLRYIRHNLKDHMNLIPNQYTCNICPYVILAGQKEIRQKIQGHFKTHHKLSSVDPTTVKRCGYDGCSAYFLTSVQLSNHKANHHLDGKLAPNDELNKFVDNLKRSMPGFKLRGCNEPNCTELFYTEDDLKTHSKLHGRFQCLFCDEVKTFAPDLSMHETEVHNPGGNPLRNIYSCVQCNLPITGSENYISHHIQVHLNLTPVARSSCSICQYVFTPTLEGKRVHKNNIMSHYNSHHDLEGKESASVSRCVVGDCKAYFLKPGQLLRHVRHIHHEEVKKSNKIFKCPYCDKKFANRDCFREHREEKHRSILKYECTAKHCPRRFESEELLKTHMKYHARDSNNLEIPCPVCKKSLRSKGALAGHMKTHEEKPVKNDLMCTECGKSFRQLHSYQMHQLKHSGPESWQFTCETCGKKCISISKLEEHQNIHKKADKHFFTCEHCGLKYAHRHNYRMHLKNKHDIVLADSRKKK